MRNPLVIVCLVIVFSATGFANIVYLHRPRNASVEFTCVSMNKNGIPFAFSLMRNLVKQEKVLYLNFENYPTIFNDADKHRITVQNDGQHKVNVSIIHLLGRHTDLYRCIFHYESGNFEDFPGMTDFFLLVEDSIPEVCSCNTYEPLLYALSAAAVLLFVCVLILAGVYCRPSSQPKPLAVPIYEEMNGVRAANGKAVNHHLSLYPYEQEETETSTYVRPCKENPYDPSPGSDPYSI